MLFAALACPLMAFAFRAPLLEKTSYEVKVARAEAGPSFQPLKESWFDSSLELDMPAMNPPVKSKTIQLVHLKSLGEEKGEEKIQVEFERYDVSTQVQIPMMQKPFVASQDIGTSLAGNPLTVRRRSQDIVGVEGIQSLLDRAKARAKDSGATQVIQQLFAGDAFKKSVISYFHNPYCLAQLEKKKVGEKWKVELPTGINYRHECEFLGWGEVKGKAVALVAVRVPSQKAGQSEAQGSGRVTFDPSSGETLEFISLDTALDGKSSRSVSWTHHYPR